MIERDFGDWSKKSKKIIDNIIQNTANDTKSFKNIQSYIELDLPKDAETQEEFKVRIIQSLNKYNDIFQDKKILYISHGCVRKIINNVLEIEENENISGYAIPLIYNMSDNNIVSLVEHIVQ